MNSTHHKHRFQHFAAALLLSIPALAFADRTGDAIAAFSDGQYYTGFELVKDGGVEETPAILYNVGKCYQYGLGGVDRDLVAATNYYAKAVERGKETSSNDGGAADAERALEALGQLEEMRKLVDDYSSSIEKINADREANKERLRKKHEEERAAHAEELKQKNDEIERLRKEGKTEAAALVKKALDEAEEKYRKQMKEAEEERRKTDEAHKKEVARLEDVIVQLKKRIAELETRLSELPAAPSVRTSTPVPPPSTPHHAGGQESPLGFAMFAPAQFPPVESDVTGFRLSVFYGRNHDIFGLDVGALVSVADGDLMGLEVSGLFNKVASSSGSMQIAGIANDCAGDFLGLQIGGIVNRTKEDFIGGQIGTFNLVSGKMGGMQIGVFNEASYAVGLQIGVVNHAARMTGVQIGLINLIDESPYPCLPIFNAQF